MDTALFTLMTAKSRMTPNGDESYRPMYPEPDLTEEPSVSGTQQADPTSSSPTRTHHLRNPRSEHGYGSLRCRDTILGDGEVIRDFGGLAD
jgi:hypothetical protein